MSKTIIQIPTDVELLTALDKISGEQRKSRTEVIRHACRKYLQETEEGRKEQIYQEGYKRTLETPEIGESQIRMLKNVWPKEKW